MKCGQPIDDTSIVRILDDKVAEEIKKLYELKSAKEKLIPMFNNFSQKIINENFFDSDATFGIIHGADEFLFSEIALAIWKERLNIMTNKFDELKRKNEDLQM